MQTPMKQAQRIFKERHGTLQGLLCLGGMCDGAKKSSDEIHHVRERVWNVGEPTFGLKKR
jgi:hypothetical protein